MSSLVGVCLDHDFFVRVQSGFSFGDWVRKSCFRFNGGTGVEILSLVVERTLRSQRSSSS